MVIHKIYHQIWWKKIAIFKSIFVFKKNHQNGHDICHQIWWKKSHFFNLFSFFKKNHQNGHDNCHQIWWFTKPITKFGEENRTFLITIHPSGPSSLKLEKRERNIFSHTFNPIMYIKQKDKNYFHVCYWEVSVFNVCRYLV